MLVIRVRIDLSDIIAQENCVLPGPQLDASGLVKFLRLRKR